MAEPIIRFEAVSKSYGGQPVLKNFSLDVLPGELLTIIGRSGCGKTTALKLVNGLITPDAGRVLVQGEDVAKTDPVALRRRIGYAIQSVGLFPHMTVEKNIAYVPAISHLEGWKGPARRERESGSWGWTRPWRAGIPGPSPAGSASGWALPGPWRRGRRSC